MPRRCQTDECTKQPSFGPPGTKVGIHCAKHKGATDVNIVTKRCCFDGCTKIPTYGVSGTNTKLYCMGHKRADDVDIANRKCRHTGCTRRASYGAAGTKTGAYCATHKEPDDINITAKKCQAIGCAKQPCCGPPGTNLRIYCASHKNIGHVNVSTNRCQAPGCTIIPTFGPLESKMGIHCMKHKGPDDISKSKPCQAPGCTTRPVYGPPGAKTGTYCAAHKEAGHIDVISKKCMALNCAKQPAFGPPGAKTGIYCGEHKRAEDVNIKKKQHCQGTNCMKCPNYGLPGTKIGLYCAEHRRTGDVDIAHKTCKAYDCTTRANYGLPGTEPDRCHKHSTRGMIADPRKRCEHCTELGIWGQTILVATRRCDAHRRTDDKNLIEGHCASCGLDSVLDKQGMCLSCGEAGKIKRQFLVKQHRVKEAIEKEFKIESYDKMVNNGVCSKKRPDIVIDGVYRKIVIEVDESQHKHGRQYTADCEYRRMWDIAQSLGTPTIFIRYNPDPFLDADGKRQNPIQAAREATLILWTRTLLARQPPNSSFASALYLYYDGTGDPENAAEECLADPTGAYEKEYMTEMADADIEELLTQFGECAS